MAYNLEVFKNGQDATTVWMNKVENGIKSVENQTIATQTSLTALEAQVATLTQDDGATGFLIDQNLTSTSSPTFAGLNIAGTPTFQGLNISGSNPINAVTNMGQIKSSSLKKNSTMNGSNTLGLVYNSITDSAYMTPQADGWYLVNNGYGDYCSQSMSFDVATRIIVTGSCGILVDNQNYTTFIEMGIFVKTSPTSIPTTYSSYTGSHCKGGGYRQFPITTILDVPSGSYTWYLAIKPKTSESLGAGIKAGHWSFATQAFIR